jgi:RNA polymerase sigma-70 factor (ECF subfamily)
VTPDTDDLFGERDRLVGIAGGILASPAEAERAVDLTFARWLSLQPEERAATGSRRERLTEILAKICLDLLGHAPSALTDSQVEAVAGAAAEPSDRVTLDDSLYMLLLVVLDSLSPEERVAFILHDVFGVAYRGIADVVGRSPDDARELARSARWQVQQRRRQREAPPSRHCAVVQDLRTAMQARNQEAVRHLLHDDVVVLIDGGGAVPAAPASLAGAAKVARLLLALAAVSPGITLTAQPVSGRAGLVARQGSRVVAVASVSVAGDAIRDIWIVLNPEKLRRWNKA